MLDILNFIFQDAWHFLGFSFLVIIISNNLGRMFSTLIVHQYLSDKKEKNND